MGRWVSIYSSDDPGGERKKCISWLASLHTRRGTKGLTKFFEPKVDSNVCLRNTFVEGPTALIQCAGFLG